MPFDSMANWLTSLRAQFSVLNSATRFTDFCHFGKFLRDYLVFGKTSNLLLNFFYSIWQIFIGVNGK